MPSDTKHNASFTVSGCGCLLIVFMICATLVLIKLIESGWRP